MHLRLIVPAEQSAAVLSALDRDFRVTNVVLMAGAAVRPSGDLVLCDAAREAVTDVLAGLRQAGLLVDGGVTLSAIEAAPSANAHAAEEAAPGSPEDAVVWDAVLDQADTQVGGSWSYYAFLTIAVILASIAVVTDSAVLVVGAMVVGPEFGVVTALALGIALRRPRLSRRALALLVKGFLLAIGIALACALAARAVGWVHPSSVSADRPLTGFIWRPDRWSAVVAVIAGCAGVLSQTAGRSNALVGVFISVTTVPAAGDLALSMSVWDSRQIMGSLTQLLLNLAGMTLAGIITLIVQRRLWRRTAAVAATG
ncbi:MAG TPA: DUF389 domain-containing protein [Jatrophihabitans sp.]|jgi:uncharacterized hydrophobic protein (TIGR00271 family)|uniref:DUF389 domain-containing protein n=1 Tax=Jatrophihabitans sp. TaxID=1932789 RepID=UPI002F1F6F42